MKDTDNSKEFLYMSIKERISKMKVIVKKEIFKSGKKDYHIEKAAHEKVLNIIKSSEPTEVDRMEILLKCDLGTYKRLDDFKSIIPLFISMIATIIATADLFFKDFNETALNIKEAFFISLLVVLAICILAILIFAGINQLCNSKIRTIEYLLGVIEKYRAVN